MSMLEAECTRCKEIFVPHGTDPEDLIHHFTEAEDECGGIGIILGEWVASDHTALYRMGEFRNLTDQEKHGVKDPDCAGKHCVHHHPELIKLP